MVRILRNPLRQHIKTHFRGRDIIFKSKATKAFNMDDEEQLDEYRHWLNIYDFLYDDTRNVLGGDSK